MKKIIRLARFQFLSASLALFGVGAFWAILLGAPFSVFRLLLGYLMILPGHLSVSFSNDYFDVEVDRFGSPATFSGGSGILVKHPELRIPARRIALTLILCSMILACLYQVLYMPPIWFIGYVALCNLLGWFYAAPPLRLAYRGWGELSTAFSAGFLLPGMGYLVMMGKVNSDLLLISTPLMLYGLGFILAVEIPDVEADRLGHKNTWVARKGRNLGFDAIGIIFIAVTGFFFIFPQFYSGLIPIDFNLLGLFSLLPLGAATLSVIRRAQEHQSAIRQVNRIIATLAMFFILTNGYLILISLQ